MRPAWRLRRGKAQPTGVRAEERPHRTALRPRRRRSRAASQGRAGFHGGLDVGVQALRDGAAAEASSGAGGEERVAASSGAFAEPLQPEPPSIPRRLACVLAEDLCSDEAEVFAIKLVAPEVGTPEIRRGRGNSPPAVLLIDTPCANLRRHLWRDRHRVYQATIHNADPKRPDRPQQLDIRPAGSGPTGSGGRERSSMPAC